MTTRRGRARPHAQGGFALVEVLLSGVVALTAAAGIMALMQSSVRSAGDLRNRTQSYSIAQEDQARLRGMRIATLKLLSGAGAESRTVTVDGTNFTVVSQATFVSDATSAASCGTSADYIRISSEVSWPNKRSGTPKTALKSIVAPPTESLKPKSGNLSVFVKDGFGKGLSAVGISGSGPSTVSGSTDETGCALFTEVPEGNYNVTPSGTNLVDKDGKSPSATTLTVNPESTTTLELQYAQFGSVPIKFETTSYSGSLVAANTENLIAYNTEMTTAKSFGTVGTKFGTSPYVATPLFPFSSTDAFYAGACTKNNPVAGSAIANVLVPAGATAATQTLILPALRLTVKKKETVKEGVTEKEVESTFSGASVKVTDLECVVSGSKVTRNFTTNASGQLAEPGLPWSTYDVCASGSVTTGIGAGKITKTRKVTQASLVVHNNTTELTLTINGASPEGTC